MFTGIITHIGLVTAIEKSGDRRVTVAAKGFTRGLAIGASVAHSGVCLTVIAKKAESFTVQVSKETLARTTLGQWRAGTRVNLERALKVGDELGGHFVSGHVDGLARLAARTKVGESWKMDFTAPAPLCRYIAPKGSVTLDGVSLTVNAVKGNGFTVNIIPHTLAATTLGCLAEGDAVNLEIDVIARYLERMRRLT